MLSMSMLTMIVGAVATPATQVKLTSDERWTLVRSLERQVGGRFILTGVGKAAGTCRAAGSCITTEGLRDAPATRGVRSVAELVANARVNGQATAAIVAIRDVRQVNRHEAQVLAAVYDAGSGRWSNMAGLFTTLSAGAQDGASQRIIRWKASASDFGR